MMDMIKCLILGPKNIDFACVRKVFVESGHDYVFDLGVQKH